MKRARWDGTKIVVLGRTFLNLDVARSLRDDLSEAIYLAEEELKPSSLVIEEAPGDMCGNTKKLSDGNKCPGCRACC